MYQTSKGFTKFEDEDEYDVNSFLNNNIDAAEALAFVDKVVQSFPTPTMELLGLRYKNSTTNEVKQCKLNDDGEPIWADIGGGGSGSGFEIVDVDPSITSRRDLGKAIYNRVEDKYKVSQVLSKNYYNWIFLSHTEGTEASRPALGYYRATDTGHWFLDNVDITNQVTEEKVEPSENTNNKLYYFDSNLCKGYKVNETYGFNVIPTGHMGDNDFHYVVGMDNGRYSSTGTVDKYDVWYEGDNRDFTPMSQYGGANANTKGSWLKTPLYNEYIKPCVIGHEDAEPKYYLNKDYYSQKEGGGISVLTGVDGDVMVKFKKLYIWFEKSQYELKNGVLIPRVIKAHISNRKLNDEYECTTGYIDRNGVYYEKNQVYMGVYTMSMFNNIIHSISGTATLVNKTRNEYVQYCKDKTDLLKAATGLTNEFYNLEHKKHINMLWLLEVMFFRNKNLNTMIGAGRVKTSNTNAINNGTMNDSGFIWGDNSQTNGRKDCGLENMVGNIHRFLGMCGISNIITGQHQIFDYTQCVDPEFFSQTSDGYEGHYEIPIPVDTSYHDYFSKELCFKDLSAMDMEINADSGSLTTYMCKNHRWHFKYNSGTYDTNGYALVGAGGGWNDAAVACLLYAASDALAGAHSSCSGRLCRF